MAAKRFMSLDHELQTVGYLSLSKALSWLKSYHPIMAVSYPTALKMVASNKLISVKVGSQHRVSASELRRYVEHGNRDPQSMMDPSEEVEFDNSKHEPDEEDDEDVGKEF